MIFGTFNISPSRAFISEPPADRILGVNVAATQFLRSLITHGSFDEYHFFVSPKFSSEMEREKKNLLYITDNAEKIKIFNIYDIYKYLAKYEYAIFHSVQAPELSSMVYARNQFAKTPFPVTSTTHSLSYQDLLNYFFNGLLMSRAQSYDALICTSLTAMKAVESILNHVMDIAETAYNMHGLSIPRLERRPLGVDTDIFCPKEDKEQLRKHLVLPKDKIIILCLGRFSANSKMDLVPLLHAFKIALSKVGKLADDVVLLLSGSDCASRWAMHNRLDEFGCGHKGRFLSLRKVCGYRRLHYRAC